MAPRLNAAGRLTDMSVGIACLLADDSGRSAAPGRSSSTQLNDERREIEQRMQLEAVELAADLRESEAAESLGVCLFDESWHQGVVGLVAGRIKDRLHRPVIAFARAEDGSLRGSARSVPGIHIRDALDSVAARHPGPHRQIRRARHGGGLVSARDPICRTSGRICRRNRARAPNRELLTGVIYSDGALCARGAVPRHRRRRCAARDRGVRDFPNRCSTASSMVEETRLVGDRHMKMRLAIAGAGLGDDRRHRVRVCRRPSDDADLRGGARLQLVYRLEINEYRGIERVQLNCQHLQAR